MSLHVTASFNLYTDDWETIECHWCCVDLEWFVTIQTLTDPGGNEFETVFGCDIEKLLFRTDSDLVAFLIQRCDPTPHQEQYIRMMLRKIVAHNQDVADTFHAA